MGVMAALMAFWKNYSVWVIVLCPLLAMLVACLIILIAFEISEKIILHQAKRTRIKAINYGADYIFEDKLGMDVGNIAILWAGSASLQEHDKFSEHENYLRMKNAYCHPVIQKIKLRETSLSQQEKHEPVKLMTLEKIEFIRWLADNSALPIPSLWFSS